MTGRQRYRRMSAEELSQALDRIGLSARQFARLSGAQPKRVIYWLEDREDVAPYVPVLLALLEELPEAMQIARDTADDYILEEERTKT